jgi:hypothetical protein
MHGAAEKTPHVTRRRSATAGESERGKFGELFHEIKAGQKSGQRLAPAIA